MRKTLTCRMSILIPARLATHSQVRASVYELAKIAGGCTTQPAHGAYVSEKGEYIVEEIVKCEWWLPGPDVIATFDEAFSKLVKIILANGEESVMYTVAKSDSYGNWKCYSVLKS